MARVLAEWGMAGMALLRERAAVLVVVDVLSFSTAVDVAVSRGVVVLPFPLEEEGAEEAARKAGAVLARPRRAGGGQFSLSPASLMGLAAGTRIMLPSPNGSRLSLAGGAARVVAGCLRNAAAVAEAVRGLAGQGMIGVVMAGERWPDGGLRPAIEDQLGAGAIIHQLGLECSAEARVARDAYRAAGDDLAAMLRDCLSGRELAERGFGGDVEVALAVGASRSVPVLVEGAYRAGGAPSSPA